MEEAIENDAKGLTKLRCKKHVSEIFAFFVFRREALDMRGSPVACLIVGVTPLFFHCLNIIEARTSVYGIFPYPHWVRSTEISH